MAHVAIVTDSNSGITQAAGKELGVRVLPMPFYINEELFFEDITLTQEAFYRRLAEDADISTSQPAPGDVTDLWEQVLESCDQVVYIPMSSGLSASCETARMLAADYKDRVFVVDNQRISITQRQSVLDALEMARAGMDGQTIHDALMRERLEASIYITVDTLKYLKKGRRRRYRHGAEHQAGAPDPGGEAGRLCQGPGLEVRQEDHAGRYGEGCPGAVRRQKGPSFCRLHLLGGGGAGVEEGTSGAVPRI